MATLRVSDVKTELGIFPVEYLDDLVIGLLNGRRKEKVKEMLLNSVDKNSKRINENEN